MYRSLLVPLDGSSFAEQALPLALEICVRSGAALHTRHGSSWFTAPQVHVVNPVGAGDAMVAGVAVVLERGEPLPAAVRYAVAAAADSVRRSGPAEVEPDAVAALLEALPSPSRQT